MAGVAGGSPANKPAPESKVWDYFQIDGSPYRKLIEKNGKPLPAAEAGDLVRLTDDSKLMRP